MLWIGLDDTDMPGLPGTGRLARELAAWLGQRFRVFGVTRHQLLQDPGIPMTANNSAAAVHLLADGPLAVRRLADELSEWVRAGAVAGSDPGLCVAQQVPEAVVAFARRAKVARVTQQEAWAVADGTGIVLRGLGGDEGGVIGALAAAGLAASGNDGRFNLCGQLRDVSGLQPVSALLVAGVALVRATSGETVTDGLVDTRGKLRPSLLDGRPVLWVERKAGHWVAVRRD